MARPANPVVQAELRTDEDGDQLYYYQCPHCGAEYTETTAYPNITCEYDGCGKDFGIKYPGLPVDPNPHQHPPEIAGAAGGDLQFHPTNSDIDKSNYITDAVVGRFGPDQQRIAQVGLEWIRTLLAKNADYGSTVWNSPKLAPELTPSAAILTRMSDKIDRLINLAKIATSGNRPQVNSESFEDTINDLGAYCLLYLARPDRQKQMTTEEAVATFMHNTNPLSHETPKAIPTTYGWHVRPSDKDTHWEYQCGCGSTVRVDKHLAPEQDLRCAVNCAACGEKTILNFPVKVSS